MEPRGPVYTPPWRALQYEPERTLLPAQLAKEIAPGHPLWGVACEVIGRSESQDDILLALPDGRYATVHLTGTGQPGDARFPRTAFYRDAAAVSTALWRYAVWDGWVDDFDPDDSRLWEEPGGRAAD